MGFFASLRMTRVCSSGRWYYWFWLLIILVPLIVFSVKPQSNLWLRIGRLALAAALCYGLMFATVGWEYSKEWEAVYAYHEKFPHCTDHECADEPPITITGSLIVFVIVLGWIPAAGYTGVWELIWRLYYRNYIRQQPVYRGRLFSAMLIIFAVIALYPTWLCLSILSY